MNQGVRPGGRGEPRLLTPVSRTSGLQNYEKTNPCCLCPFVVAAPAISSATLTTHCKTTHSYKVAKKETYGQRQVSERLQSDWNSPASLVGGAVSYDVKYSCVTHQFYS